MSSASAIAPLQPKSATDRCRMLSILLPVRNEGINLRIMLKILRAVVELPHEVLVVYDSDNDNSIPVVDEVREIYPELPQSVRQRCR
jgi:glycosyltransferase involved in cell wall biosynthesis